MTAKPRVYLAGPGVFREDPGSFGKTLKEKCERAGLVGCFPLDAEIPQGPALETAQTIYRANRTLIDSARAIIADISPFRGPNMDPGTAWEIGYGIAKQLPVFAWTDNPELLLSRTVRHVGSYSRGDAPVDDKGWTIENFGLAENLMIAVSCAFIHQSADEAIAACATALSKTGQSAPR